MLYYCCSSQLHTYMLKCKKGINNMLKIVKKEKDGKTFYNIFLFGVAIRTVNAKDYLKLYYQCKGYINGNTNDGK